MSPCPSREQLQQVVGEQLSDDIREAIEGHVEACVKCQDVLGRLNDEDKTNDWRYLRSSRPLSMPESDADIARNLKENSPGQTGPAAEPETEPAIIRFPGPPTT